MSQFDDIGKKAAESAKNIYEQINSKPKEEQVEEAKSENIKHKVKVKPEKVKPKDVEPASEDNNTLTMFMKSVEETGMELTAEENKIVASSFVNYTQPTVNYQSILRRCPGDCEKRCEHFAVCPFTALDKYPVGKPCPLEKAIADSEMVEYVRTLNKDPSTLTLPETNMILSFIECDISEIRMRNKINDTGYLVATPLFAVNRTGEVIMGETINKAFEIQERIARRKELLAKSLMFTPEIKVKHKVDDNAKKEMSPAEALVIARKALEAGKPK